MPPCPQCGSGFSYSDGTALNCPECGHAWMPGEQAAVIVQAEAHVGPDGELMEVLGLILPDGGGAVALLDDVDLVDDTDPTWRDLVARAVDMDGED